MERKDLLEANGKDLRPQGQALDRVADRNVKVLVSGNPANTNCLIAMKNAPSLEAHAVFTGMMRARPNRASSQLAAKVNMEPVSSIRKSPIWGNHSADPISRRVPAEADGKKIWPMINDQSWLETTFIPNSRSAARRSSNARLSSAASAANAASIMCATGAWLARRRLAEMGIPSRAATGVPEGVIYGYPVTAAAAATTIVKASRSANSAASAWTPLKELHEERDGVKHLLGNDVGSKVREAVKAERPLQVIGHDQRNHALHGEARRLQGNFISTARRRRPGAACRISAFPPSTTSSRYPAHHRGLRPAVAWWMVDTGFGASAFNVARTTRSLVKFGAAAMHIEDQVGAKRCGTGRARSWSQGRECDRIKAAVDARRPGSSSWRAPTALASEGLDRAVEACPRYVEAGADMIFPEAITELRCTKSSPPPVRCRPSPTSRVRQTRSSQS